MSTSTAKLGLTAYNFNTDASSVLISDYVNAVSGSSTDENLYKIDTFAGNTSASLTVMNASLVTLSASMVIANASLVNLLSASPVYPPSVVFYPEDSVPPFSGLTAAYFETSENSATGTMKMVKPQLKFPTTIDTGRQWNFRVPGISGSSCTLNIVGRMTGANSTKTINMVTQIGCISVGDTSASTKAYATAQSATVTVPDTAYTNFAVSIPIVYADSMATDDEASILIYLDSSEGTATGSFIYVNSKLQWLA